MDLIEQTEHNTFDAIVVGSGISGGWAAKELTEKGLRTVVIERGRKVEHIKDYPTALMNPWQFKHRLNNSLKDLEERPVQSSHCDPGNKHFFVNDLDHPYIQEDKFKWIRGYQVGGRSLTWGRQCYRLSDLDFEANKREGIGVDWPIRYKDIAPWYDYVESYVGISGKKEGLQQLPDGNFLPPIQMNCIEQHLADEVSTNYRDRRVINSRVANLTKPVQGRGVCQFRNLCSRGCPFSGYFSSNSTTLLDARNTNKLTLLVDSIVKEIIYDEKSQRATGIKIIDATTLEERIIYSKIIFLNASTIASTAILLNSQSSRFPNGLGNTSGQLGHNLMDHTATSGTKGEFDGLEDKYYSGRTPGSVYIPRFQNLTNSENLDFVRGYGIQGKGERQNWQNIAATGVGEKLKEQLSKPGKWEMWLGGRGEILPNFDNKISLDPNQKDKWGLPLVKIYFKYGDNEERMIEHMKTSCEEILRKSGFKNIVTYRTDPDPGSSVHEMGTARMGNDPKSSVLNAHNQLHDVKNIFVTDGSCMSSSGCQNPSLTYMALTARACDFAVSELKKGNL